MVHKQHQYERYRRQCSYEHYAALRNRHDDHILLMKNFTLQSVSDESVYIVIERDDGTTFGKQVPASHLSGDQAQMLAQLDQIAFDEDLRQSGPSPVPHQVLGARVGEKFVPKPRPTKEELQAEIDKANAAGKAKP